MVSYHSKKKDLIEWAYENREVLAGHSIIAAGTTGGILEGILGRQVEKLSSLLTGGDRQLAGLIREEKIDVVLFFYEPGKPNKRNGAVGQLIQLATDRNLIMATNFATARVVLDSLSVLNERGKMAGGRVNRGIN